MVYDPVRSADITEFLLLQDKPEASFVPVMVGTYAFINPSGLEWYPHWIMHRGQKLIKVNKKWFINIALWQLLALITNPFTHFSFMIVEIDQFIKNLALYEKKNETTRLLTRIK